jgi:hypothetical protein
MVRQYITVMRQHMAAIRQRITVFFRRLQTEKNYRIVKLTWIITSWIWTVVIVGIIVNLVPGLLTQDLTNTQAAAIIKWLYNPIWDFWRVFAFCVLICFVIITLVALLFKQLLQPKQPEVVDKLVDFLKQDTIPPQLDQLSDQLDKQIEYQYKIANGLTHVYNLLKQDSTPAHLQNLYTLVEQQLDLQDELRLVLRNLHKAPQQAEISTISTELDYFIDLYQHDRHMLQAISTDLQGIANRLELLLNKWEVPVPLRAHGDGEPLSSDHLQNTEHQQAIVIVKPEDEPGRGEDAL